MEVEVANREDASGPVVELLDELLRLAKDGPTQPADLQRLFSAGAARILAYKASHRELCEATEAAREATAAAKLQLDTSSLQLQNLLYEKQHYEKEIRSCRAFRSKYSDEQLELMPEADFLAAAPQPGERSPHQLMLDRLAAELASREEAVKGLDAAKAARDALAAEVATRRGALATLDGEVAKLRALAGAAAAQGGAPQPPAPQAGAAERAELVAAAALPLPLYVLYTQLRAAAAAARGPTGDRPAAADVALAGDLPRSDGGAEPPADAEAFPLAVELTLRRPAEGAGAAAPLLARFSYLPRAGRVAVAGGDPDAAAALAALFPADAGPAPALAARPELGAAYEWAQAAAGLDLLPALPPGPALADAGTAAAAAAAVAQYAQERRAAALLERLLAAAGAAPGSA